MKKIIILSAIVFLGLTTKAQTAILKQEIDTALITTIFNTYATNQITLQPIVAKNFKEKKDFVNDMMLVFLKKIIKESVGTKAANVARKTAEDNVDTKVIQKLD